MARSRHSGCGARVLAVLSHFCYSCRMTDVASRELRNDTRALLDRVARGETLTITVHGRPTAILAPVSARPRWLPRERFVAEILSHQADPGLRNDLRSLTGDETTDDLPL